MHMQFDPHAAPAPLVSFDDFLKVDIRIGTVLEALEYPEARNPSYKLVIDFGPGVGLKKSSAQLTQLYRSEDLQGKRVAAVVNFPPRQIGKYVSEVLVLGFANVDREVVLFSLDHSVPNGARLF